MNLVMILLAVLELVHVSRCGFLDWFRNDPDADGHKVGRVHIEVLSPKGVRLWSHYNPETELFGVELYVKYYGGQTEALECSLCRNTSEPVDGKFMLEDDNLVARFGDVLQYVVITSNGTTTMRHRAKRVFVREEHIKPSDRCICYDRASSAMQSEPTTQVQLLERMILRALANRSESCESISNWLVLRAEPRNELADLGSYVQAYLDLLHLRARLTVPDYDAGWSPLPPSKLVVQVDDHVDGIAFQLKSTMDKLKMLELMNINGVLADFDGIF